ncbi:MAG: NAD(P)/FAD-dependent oxidoreductase [bacterium]
MSDKTDILIIGGGPAGIFAAVAAARKAKRPINILILEHNFMMGRKLLKTGNGRCNLTNRDISPEHYHGRNRHFLHGVFARFTNRDLLGYFEDMGVEFKEEEGGCLFPVTDQASTILDILKEDVERHGIGVALSTKVEKIGSSGNGGFIVRCADGKEFTSRRLIIATGGLTYPQLGALGDGYAFAKSFGHNVVPTFPALVPLEIEKKALCDLQGVKATVDATALQSGKRIASVRDEILFTHYGVSGPAVLHLSSFIVTDLAGKGATITVNFFPGVTQAQAEEKIVALWKKNPKRLLGNSLIGILPKKLAQFLIRHCSGMDVGASTDSVTRRQRMCLVRALTGLEIAIKAPLTFKDAQVTAGGVSTDKVDGKTMESRLVKGLYFAGEVLDVNGDCGGYNLQFAFSSGYLAGAAAVGD